MTKDARGSLDYEFSVGEIEQLIDEPILLALIVADPPRLSLVNHVYRLVTRRRSPRGVEGTKAPLGFHAAFDRTMVLLRNVVQILDWSMAAAPAQNSFPPLSLSQWPSDRDWPYRC